MLDTEKKKKLRKLLIELDPQEGYSELVNDVEKSSSSIEEMKKLFDAHKKEWRKAMKEAMDEQSRQHEIRMAEFDRKSSAAVQRLSSVVDEKSEKHSKELAKVKEENTQIISKLRDEIRISYSKMGGASMPVLLQQEDAVFVPDGVTTTYYFYNKPVYIVVGGAQLVAGDGYSTPVPQTDGWEVTFVNPPAAATTYSSAQTPHSFHY
jgi:hypothetical protein